MSIPNTTPTPLPAVREGDAPKVFCNAIVQDLPTGVTPVRGAGIWIVDRTMRVRWMNDVMEEIYGPFKNVQYKNCFRAFRGREDRCPDCLPSKAFETGNILSGYVSRVTRDGIERYYQLVEAPLMDENNEVSHVAEIVLDVTEKARLEKSIREAAHEYRALFEHAGTAVVVTDSEGSLVKVNNHFEELSGYQRDEIEGKIHYLQFVHPKDRKRVAGYDQLRAEDPEKSPASYEFLFVNRWGAERLVHISVNALPGSRQQISSMIDLTEKWKLEQEIQSKNQFLANILRHSVEAIIAMDRDGIVRSWNRGAESMFGYTTKEIVGRRFSTILTGEFRRNRKMARFSEQFEKQGYIRDASMDALTKDGKLLTISVTRTMIRAEDGREIGSSAIIRDMTASRRIEQRTVQQERMHALGELAASLAHEIKNPLNSMVINMEVLKGHLDQVEPDKKEAMERYVDVLASEIKRLNKVIQGVLDFSRPIDGHFGAIRIQEILDHVMELVSAQATREKIGLKVQVDPNLPEIDGAEDYLKQILLNLLLNAFQAMPKGGRVTVKVSQDRSNSINIGITDTGSGIPRRNYKKIFDLYFSTKEKGSGLGLPLAKRLVNAHGGKITFKSRINHGTTFNITLPAS